MGAMAEVKKPNNTIDKLALIVTTYKRQQLLETLFDSILALEQAPWRIVIVDNEQSDQTPDGIVRFPRCIRPVSEASSFLKGGCCS